MKYLIVLLPFLILIAVTNACATKPTQSQPQESTSIQGNQGASLKQPWEVEWNNILSAARKEGKVVVVGPPGDDVRQHMLGDFVRAYPGIEVNWIGTPTAAFVPKVMAERRAGLYTTDLLIAGTTSIITSLKSIARPIEPLLTLPEVKDGKYWRDGSLTYADSEGKFDLMFATYVRLAMIYNPQLLVPKKAQELSFWDLAKPEFKGKIIMVDPRIAGPGQSFALFLYLHPQLGQDYLRALVKNDVLWSRDYLQQIEWISAGKYSVGLAVDELTLASLRKGGIQNVSSQSSLKEGSYLTAGFGSLMLPDNTPHPNAAKVYLNWLLSKKGQEAWIAGSGTPTLRMDVSMDQLDPDLLLRPGLTYINSSKEDVVKHRQEMVDFIVELIGR